MRIQTTSKSNSTFRNPKQLITRECYEYYKENRKKVAKAIDQYNYFVKALNGIMTIARRMATESEGGLYIEGFGYFCHVKIKTRPLRKRVPNSLIRRITYTDIHLPYFEPDIEFEGWSMTYAFDDYYMRCLDNKRNYKIHFDLMLPMRVAHDYDKKMRRRKYVKGYVYRDPIINKKNKIK